MRRAGCSPAPRAFSRIQPLRIPAGPERRLYRCADGRFISVAAAEPRTWAALCKGLGIPDLEDKLYVAAEAEAARERLEAIFAERPAQEWVDMLAPLGAAVNAVNAGPEVRR